MAKASKIISLEEALQSRSFEDNICVIGVFDGMHVGHQSLIEQAKSYAKEQGKKSVIFTFDRDPDEIFGAKDFEKLLDNEQRIQACVDCGVDIVVIAKFDEDFYSLSAQEFLDKFFEYLPFAIFVGPEFRFGAQAAGDVESLKKWGRSKVFKKKFCDESGERISSTKIRNLLARGELKKAENLLKNRDCLA